MKIQDAIGRIFPRYNKKSFLRPSYWVGGWGDITCLPFGDLVFQNVVEMLTDLNNDVTFTNIGGNKAMDFAEFVRFFEDWGETALYRVYRYGFAVIGIRYSNERKFIVSLRLLDSNEFTTQHVNGNVFVVAKDPDLRVYVMKSPTFISRGVGDYDLCRPAVEFLDNTMNASNTSVKKLGAFVVASPETGAGAPTPVVLREDDKKDMEKEIAKEYGLLSKQRQVMLLPRSMNFQTISLTNIDNKLTERVRMNVELIADRLKVPASQIAVIDATAGKSLSNGGEVHEGDRLKYKTYERLLNKTFVAFAEALGLSVSYTIYNKPADAVTGTVTTIG